MRLASFWDRALAAGLAALAFLLPLAFFLKTYQPALAKDLLLLAGGVLAVAFSGARTVELGRLEWPANRTWLLVAADLLIVWTALSLFQQKRPEPVLFDGLRFLAGAALYAVVLAGPASPGFSRSLAGAVTAAGAAVAAFAAARGFGLWTALGWDGMPLGGPAALGIFCAFSAPFAASIALDPERRMAARGLAGASAAGAYAAAFYTGEPAAAAALLAAGSAAVLVSPFLPAPARRAALAQLAVAAAAALSLVGRPEFEARWLDWAAGAPSVAALAGLPFQPGRIGGLLLAGLFGGPVVLALALLRRRTEEPRDAALTAGHVAALAALAAGAFFGAASDPALRGLAWLTAASLAGLALHEGSATVRVLPIPAPAAGRRVLYAPLAAFMAVAWLGPARALRADIEFNLGWVNAELGDEREAARRFSHVPAWHPQGVEARYRAGQALQHRGTKLWNAPSQKPREELRAALERFAEAEALVPHYRKVDFQKGVILSRLADFQGAADSFLAAASADPSHVATHENLVEVLTILGRKREAISAAARLAALQPDDPERWRLLGRKYREAGNSKVARRMLDRAEKTQDVAGSPLPPRAH